MSSTEDLLRLDSAMRIAREIGKQAGVDPEKMKEWYEEVVMGEMLLGQFFVRLEAEVKDPVLHESLVGLRKNLHKLGSEPQQPNPLVT